MITLALDEKWHIYLDASGSLAKLEGDACAAQSVANAQRCFKGEAYYNQPRGIPYFEEIEGHLPPNKLVIAQLERAAETVPDVVSARTTIRSFQGRTVEADTVSETENGGLVNVSI